MQKNKCEPPYHVFRIRGGKKDSITCVCKKYTQDFNHIKADNINIRVFCRSKISFRGVD